MECPQRDRITLETSATIHDEQETETTIRARCGYCGFTKDYFMSMDLAELDRDHRAHGKAN